MPKIHSNSQPIKALAMLFSAFGLAPLANAQSCQRSAGARPPVVVELFTSQGCSSCPPADHWLSTLKDDKEVIALSFHVNYWNYLGWKDPYATPETTDRQRKIQQASHGKYVYTPQVVLNGQDYRAWHGQNAKGLPRLPADQAPSLSLVRDGVQVTAEVGAHAGRTQMAGYWAVVQDRLSQQVTKGENAGVRLVNDHVVTLYQPVAAWNAKVAHIARLTLPPGVSSQRVIFVVTNSSHTQPLQAAGLTCG